MNRPNIKTAVTGSCSAKLSSSFWPEPSSFGNDADGGMAKFQDIKERKSSCLRNRQWDVLGRPGDLSESPVRCKNVLLAATVLEQPRSR
jgi:hypothetical protein